MSEHLRAAEQERAASYLSMKHWSRSTSHVSQQTKAFEDFISWTEQCPMNTLARSLDALLGPAMSRRPRKRDVRSLEDGNGSHNTVSRPTKKRKRTITLTEEDGDEDQDGRMHAIAPSVSIIPSIRLFAKPVKRLKSPVVQQQPVKVLNFSRLGFCVLPPTINSLLKKIRQCAKGFDTIPDILKDQILEQDPDLDSDDDVWQTDTPSLAGDVHPRARSIANSELRWSRTPSMTPGVPPSQQESVSTQTNDRHPSFSQVEIIVEQARECNDVDDFEPGWDSQVNGPLLTLACHLSRHRSQVKSVNLTPARPHACLATDVKANNTNKMVDFGLCLQSSDKLKAAYRQMDPEADGKSRYFNHTDFEQIAQRPLAISIETQREGRRGSQADIQLSAWVKAHMSHLADLRKRPLEFADRTIWLPVLKAIGPVWYLLLACGNYNESGDLFYTTIYSRYQLGDITTYHGFFQVLAALFGLIHWAETVYRPWFEEWVSSSEETEVVAVWDDAQVLGERRSAIDGSQTKRVSLTSFGSYEISY